MNCPNCGAENDADARFCGECGTPLENQDIEATIVGQSLRTMADDDATILASPSDIAVEEAKTVTVDQAALAEAAPSETSSTSQPDAPAVPPPSPSEPLPVPIGGSAGGDDVPHVGLAGEGSNRKMWIIVGVIVLLILCCCCCSIGIGGALGSDPNTLEDILRELSWLPVYLPLV